MLFLQTLEISAVVILFVFGVTQIIVPVLTDKPWFPVFRSGKKQLKRELAAVNEKLEDAKIKRQIKEKEGMANESGENSDPVGS